MKYIENLPMSNVHIVRNILTEASQDQFDHMIKTAQEIA